MRCTQRTLYLFAVLTLVPKFIAGADLTFSRDILPILEKRCQSCHRAGGGAPMPLTTWAEVRPWARAIREVTRLGKMPPWFADPHYGSFANDPRLTSEEVTAISAWVEAGAPEGERLPLAASKKAEQGWRIFPDLVVRMPKPFSVPAGAVIDYQYIVIPLNLATDRWVSGVEIRPANLSVVHHAVLYVRPSDSNWLRNAPSGTMFARKEQTTEDILAIYTPGASARILPEGMAKKIPAGADLVLQVHYTSGKKTVSDQTSVALRFAAEPPVYRVLTLQMGRDDLQIPPYDASYRTSVSGTLPRDALLISLFPHMHLRGSGFDFEAFGPSGQADILLRVRHYDFYWQFSYLLDKPKLLRKGTVLKWTGYFNNSKNNPRNPDASAEVGWGEQSDQEMMIGFFDVAVEPTMDKKDFFLRQRH